jgi:hypothetical protein
MEAVGDRLDGLISDCMSELVVHALDNGRCRPSDNTARCLGRDCLQTLSRTEHKTHVGSDIQSADPERPDVPTRHFVVEFSPVQLQDRPGPASEHRSSLLATGSHVEAPRSVHRPGGSSRPMALFAKSHFRHSAVARCKTSMLLMGFCRINNLWFCLCDP